MSTSPLPTPSSAPEGRREILIVSHSTLFYWWPVWVVGYLMAILSLPWVTGARVATVPEKAVLLQNAEGTLTVKKENKTETYPISDRHVLVDVESKEARTANRMSLTNVHISTSKNPGVLFSLILLLVIFITNVPLRGLWSVIVIIFIVALVIILALLNVLDNIMDALSLLDIRISAGAYVVISTVLLILWMFVFFFFDRQIYMVFTPGQLRVKLEIGDAETAYDTTGMTIQKQRSDLFRHWVLGLGSGDLIVRTSGAQSHHFDMHNVLFLGRKVREIEDLLRSRQVVSGQ